MRKNIDKVQVCFLYCISRFSTIVLTIDAQWDRDPQWENSFLEISNFGSEALSRQERSPTYPAECHGIDPFKPIPETCPLYQKKGECGCYRPPFWPHDAIRIELEGIGFVRGYSMVYSQNRYVNMFLGIPYAKPPISERRFKPPEWPGIGWEIGEREWDCSYYRDACPQEESYLQDKFSEVRNFTENCLHMNIFMPNLTDQPQAKHRYEVMVLVHGEDFKMGDAMMFPAHVLAKKEVVVVTFNYRLGALGFLSTEDENSPGNYGMMDVLHALKFIKRYIRQFRGDPDKVTLVGHGSGAALVALLLLSPKSESEGSPLFHQVIMMGGSDLCEWSFVDWVDISYYERSNPREFAKDLGRLVGCSSGNTDWPMNALVACLRWKHFDEIVNASSSVYKKYGKMWGPFGPVVDGEILPNQPRLLREAGKFMKIPVFAGLNKDEGAYLAVNASRKIAGVHMDDGLEPATFRRLLEKIIEPRADIYNQQEVVDAMEFEYTFWAKPDNKSAVRQNLINLYSDWVTGSCIDDMFKYHILYDAPVYAYLFAHRSEFEPLPLWMGVPKGKDLAYLFAQPFYDDLFAPPFYNATLMNITGSGLIPDQQDWTLIDRNVSENMQQMWVNFTKYGNPTTNWQPNVTWYPYQNYNMSYLYINGEFSYMDINLRRSYYEFWQSFFPLIASRFPEENPPGSSSSSSPSFEVIFSSLLLLYIKLFP